MTYIPNDETIDRIWRDLHQGVSRHRVAEEASRVADDFAEARVTAYVPIFVQRATRERLLREVLIATAALNASQPAVPPARETPPPPPA
jgi:hypothetical protein